MRRRSRTTYIGMDVPDLLILQIADVPARCAEAVPSNHQQADQVESDHHTIPHRLQINKTNLPSPAYLFITPNPPQYFQINHVMNHRSDDDVRLHDVRGGPDVEQQEKQHDQPDVLQHHVYAFVLAAASVELAEVYHCQHDQDEEVEDEGEGLRSAGQDVQGSDDQEREEAELEFIDLLDCLLDGSILLLDLSGLDGSMVKCLRTLLSIHLRLLLTLLILALPVAFPSTIDQFFDEADNHDDEVNQHEEEGNEDDASLTILNLSVRHFNLN